MGRQLKRVLTAVPLAAVLVQGCQSIAPSDYLTAAGDGCGSQRAELKAVEDYFDQNVLTGTVIGAVGGAATGALLGYLISGDARGAAIGAGAGLAAGAVGGYFVSRQQAAQDREALVRTVYDDATRESQQVTRAGAAFDALKTCRFTAAQAIKQDYRAGVIPRAEAESRLARQRQLFDEDIAYAQQLGAKMTERSTEFAHAATQLEQGSAAGEPATTTAMRSGASAATPARTSKPATQKAKPAAPAKTAAPPPVSPAGVRTLTESTQNNVQRFTGGITQAQAEAGPAFQLEGTASRTPYQPWPVLALAVRQ